MVDGSSGSVPLTSVVDPDPGSDAFLTPGSGAFLTPGSGFGMSKKQELVSGFGMINPYHISESLENNFLG
jgi:hypothetical protein